MLRFSLSALLTVVFLVALGCAALLYPNEIWRRVLVTLALGSLLFATVLAVVRRDRPPVFAVGFAITGWIYLLLVFNSVVSIQDHLLTTQSIHWLRRMMHEEDPNANAGYVLLNSGPWQQFAFNSGGAQSIYTSTLAPMLANSPSIEPSFAVIGQSLWTLILACLGGFVACLVCRRRATPPEQAAGP
jgi:hypothetical protein